MVKNRRLDDRGDGCCNVSFLKYLVFIYHFVFYLAGSAILLVGLWTVFFKSSYVVLLATKIFSISAYLLILAGVLCILIGVVGCVGLTKENKTCILIFACTLFLIFVVQISAGILAYVYSDAIDVGLQENFQDTLRHNYGLQDDVTKAVDSLHRKYGCCGAVDYKDWRHSAWYNKTNYGKVDNQVQQYSNTTFQDQDRKLLKVPHICCKTMNKITCGERDHPSNIYLYGCSTVLKDEMKEHVVVLGATALGISAVQIFGIFVSCALYAKLGKNDGFNDRQPFATTSSYRKRRSNM